MELKKINKLPTIYFWLILLLFVTFLIIIFNKFENLPNLSHTRPNQWCSSQPCLNISNLVIVQPTSSIFVYSLGLISIIFGLIFLGDTKLGIPQKWWGIALLLWGIGALLAGTSYQAFSYEIKCSGRSVCLQTSWWEVIYMIFSVASVNSMLMTQAYHKVSLKLNKGIKLYASIHLIIYSFIVLIGSIILNKLLISFEFMVLTLAPTIIFLLVFNLVRFRKYHNQEDKDYALIWITLILIILIYFIYYFFSITQFFWEKGLWLSENDILHISLIFWMLFIFKIIKNKIIE